MDQFIHSQPFNAGIDFGHQGLYSRTSEVTIYRRLRIGRDGNVDQSEAYDVS